MRKKIPAVPFIVWVTVFTIIPLGLIAVFAFTDPNFGGFSLTNLRAVSSVWPAFMRSLYLATIATVLCLLIGFPFAYIISKAPAHRQTILYMLAVLPMWINFILKTYAWMTLLENNGLINHVVVQIAQFFGNTSFEGFHMINTQGAVVLGMVYDYVPFMILPIYSALVKIDKSMIEAAQDLGASPRKVLTRVLIPMTWPGISTGIIMVFVPAISTFIISQRLGGGMHEMIGDVIEARFMSSQNIGSALSLVLMLVVFMVISLVNNFDDEEVGDMIK